MPVRAHPLRRPAFDDAGTAAARAFAVALWTAESGRERDRLLALPASMRLTALDDDAIRSLLRPEHRAELRASLAPVLGVDAERRNRAMEWARERRALVALRLARPLAAVAVPLAALAPPLVQAWRWRWTAGDVLAVAADGAALATPATVFVALCAGLVVLVARATARARDLGYLGWLVALGIAAGVVGTAAARQMPVYRAWATAPPLTDGRSLAGAIVHASGPDTLRVIVGNRQVPAGTVISIDGTDPVRTLRGGVARAGRTAARRATVGTPDFLSARGSRGLHGTGMARVSCGRCDPRPESMAGKGAPGPENSGRRA